jgi:hypothetical protein
MEGYDKTDRALIDRSIQEAKAALAIDPGSVLALLTLARGHGNALLIQLAVNREEAIRRPRGPSLGRSSWTAGMRLPTGCGASSSC